MKLGIPAGGMALSATGAATYMQAIINAWHSGGKLLQRSTKQQMMQPQNTSVAVDNGFPMGLTWFLQHPINSQTLYAAHPGELAPYHSMLVLLPELKTGVFIAINSNQTPHAPAEMAYHIMTKLYTYHSGKSIPHISIPSGSKYLRN